MELRHLRYFVAVAEELTLRRAAARLHIAPPPLSVQIRNLEIEIGTPLFTRAGRGMQLTDAGRVFLDEARKVLAQTESGVARARRAASGDIGELTIGYNAPAEFLVFPHLIPPFRQRWPEIQLSFQFRQLRDVLAGLHSGDLDIGFAWLPLMTDEFEMHALLEEVMLVAMHESHPLADKESVRIADLSGVPLVMVSIAQAFETRQQIEGLFARAGARMEIAFELDNSLSMINFVAMGAGCALVPAYARRIAQTGVVFRPLDAMGSTKTLAMLWRPNARDVGATFRRFACDMFPGVASLAG